MYCLSLWNPWATLIALREKRVETRTWRLGIRKNLAIHAAKKWNDDLRMTCLVEPFRSALSRHEIHHANTHGLPFGAIVCVVDVIDCLPTAYDLRSLTVFAEHPHLDTPQEREFGDYSPGRWGIVLDNIRPLRHPVPTRGYQSVWRLPPDVELRVREELEDELEG